MKCPFCQEQDTKVLDSRLLSDGYSIRRRRKCQGHKCERRFTTYEKIETSMPMVIKNDGRRENYSRDKVFGGIEKASQKRPVSTAQLEHLLTNIERDIQETHQREVTTKTIGKKVMMYLRHLDPVAYVRFASVYSNFQDIEEFVGKLQDQEKKHTHIFHAGI